MSVKANFGFDLDADQLSFKLGSPAIPPEKFGGGNEAEAEAETVEEGEEKAAEEAKPSIRISHRYGHRHLSRKAASEEALSRQLDWYFREGDCYHCFSFGDVDSLTFFKHVLRQQRVLYLALSTWCMAGRMWTTCANGTGAGCWAAWTSTSARSSRAAIRWYTMRRWIL